jgi:hypothetical protein
MKGKMPSYFSLLLSTSEVGLGGHKNKELSRKVIEGVF